MSFILDALKKSESERQRQAGPALLEMRIVRPTRRLPIWAVIVGIGLILCVGVLAWVALRPTPVAAPATAAITQTPAAGAVPAGNALGTPQAAPGAATAAPAMVAPAASAPAAPAANPTPPQTDSQSSAAADDNNPADTEPAVVPQSASASESANAANLRTYAELGNSLPELRLDLHVYAANPAERYAFINMHKVREGDVTAEGVQVKEITREGVVLSFRGTEFLLGRQ
jgi:general secretion pathway protein B